MSKRLQQNVQIPQQDYEADPKVIEYVISDMIPKIGKAVLKEFPVQISHPQQGEEPVVNIRHDIIVFTTEEFDSMIREVKRLTRSDDFEGLKEMVSSK